MTPAERGGLVDRAGECGHNVCGGDDRGSEGGDLDELRITDIRPRRAATGALILDIPGREGGHEKASLLVERMASLLRDTPVKVNVSRKTKELRVAGLENSITMDEVVAAVTEAVVATSEVSADVLPFAPRGLGSV
jgi:hypothetical protein